MIDRATRTLAPAAVVKPRARWRVLKSVAD
jgi:hypothetical protein